MSKRDDLKFVTGTKSGDGSMIPQKEASLMRKREPCSYGELVVGTLMKTSSEAYNVGFHYWKEGISSGLRGSKMSLRE